LHDVIRSKQRSAKPSDTTFCAQRSWDQRAESGFMKQIEDRFQEVARRIVHDPTITVNPEDMNTLNLFLALWARRTQHRVLEAQNIKLNVVAGEPLTIEQQENLEKNHYTFMKEDGTIPARHLNGLKIQMGIRHDIDRLKANHWCVVRARSGEFIVPDTPLLSVIPLTPHLIVANYDHSLVLDRAGVAAVNQASIEASSAYYFARNLAACPTEMTLTAPSMRNCTSALA
jgi:hypothetical protein